MKKLIVILAACAVGVAFALAFAGRSESTATANCAGLSIPVGSDFNLAYSPESGDLLIDYTDSAGHGAEAIVDSRAAACNANPGVARAIQHAHAAARDVTDGDCASFKALLNGTPAVTKDGRTGDPAAAKDYVDKYCH
ncbi:MAG: hypothetical protein ABI948_02860 [Thermoleophilia bacterium]